jgi:hypothetical protein
MPNKVQYRSGLHLRPENKWVDGINSRYKTTNWNELKMQCSGKYDSAPFDGKDTLEFRQLPQRLPDGLEIALCSILALDRSDKQSTPEAVDTTLGKEPAD